MIDEHDGKELDAESRACYRQDRCDLQFAVKELARRVAAAEHQEHASAQAFLKRGLRSEVLDSLRQTS